MLRTGPESDCRENSPPDNAVTDFLTACRWEPSFFAPVTRCTLAERKATSVLGFSLIELLIVISIMGIFAGVVLTSFDPSIHDRLQGTAQILATDIAYARDLAVTNNSTYTITFDTTTHQYVIEHSGTNTALETLPETPFRNPSDPPDQQITDLQNLPFGGGPVELIAVHDLTPSIVTVTDVEFGPLGETTRSFDMQIWLAAGEGEARRYLPMLVHPVTGLTTLGELQTEAPPGPD